MDSGAIKRNAAYLVLGALVGVLVWKAAPLFNTSGVAREAPTQGPHAPPGSVLVNVNMTGFDPASIPATAGQPLKLAFFRPTELKCTREVVFPELGLRKQLPPGEIVVVDVTPQKSGPLGFECGMGMLKGQLIVR
jgi:plastocyanin domain-containing protein